VYDAPRVAVGAGCFDEVGAVAEAKSNYKAIRPASSHCGSHGALRTGGSSASWRTQDERGPPKVIIARSFFAAEIGWTPFQLSRKILARLQIVPRLADQGRYPASESTFYRILRAEKQLTHRRSERPAQTRTKPRAICATAPNQLYSWDITYLPSLIRGQFFYRYLFVDIFSRKIVGWQVYEEENSA